MRSQIKQIKEQLHNTSDNHFAETWSSWNNCKIFIVVDMLMLMFC